MNLVGFQWTALMDMQPQRSHRIAWFVYGWLEREHILNVTTCADWWMRAMGLSAAPIKTPLHGIGKAVPPVTTQVLARDGDRAESSRHRSPSRVGPLS